MGKLFGTFGVRGLVGELITPKFAMKIAHAYSTALRGGKVVLGTDTRTSRDMLKAAMISGFLAGGSEVIDVGVAPTPAIQLACKKLGSDGGAAITASHNPPEYNGIKLLEGDGLGLQPEPEGVVEENYFTSVLAQTRWDDVKSVKAYDILPEYIEGIVSRIDGSAIKKGKPEPDIIFEVLKRLKLKKEDILFVGDHEIDIETCKNAGCKMIGFKIDSDYRVEMFEDILKVVEDAS